jgi:hypothetical protein
MNTVATRPERSPSTDAQRVLDHATLIQEVAQSVMKEGEHYGAIPGCGPKPTLLKAGAEKLLATFQLVPLVEVIQTDMPNGHREYRITVSVQTREGSLVGQGVGTCSTLEAKYRWRGGKRLCPDCGADAIIKGKKEYGGGWICFQKKGGCGNKWNDGAAAIEGQAVERVENPDIADTYNTVLKMGKKRALVDAAITATAASDFFTQDLDELQEAQGDHPRQEAAAPAPVQAATTQPSKPATEPAKPAPVSPVQPNDERTKAQGLFKAVATAIPECKPAVDALWRHHNQSWQDKIAVFSALMDSITALANAGTIAQVRRNLDQMAKDLGGDKPTGEHAEQWRAQVAELATTGALPKPPDKPAMTAADMPDEPPF